MLALLKLATNSHVIWASLLAGAILTNCVTGHQRDQLKVDIATLKADQLAAQEEALRQLNTDQLLRIRNNERIQDETSKRERATEVALASGRGATQRLQQLVDQLNAGDLPSDPGLAAFARQARAARSLLGQCSTEYRAMDQRAKELGGQVMGLQDFALTVCRAGQDQQSAVPSGARTHAALP